MKLPLLLLCGAAAAVCEAQTPPIQPNIATIPVPPAITLPGPQTDLVGKPITATEASRIALRYGPSIRIAQAQILSAQGRTQQVRSALVPNASVSAGYTRFQSFRTSLGGSSSSS